MNRPDLVIAFDLGRTSYDFWPHPGIALIFVAIGIILVCFPKHAMEFSNAAAHPRLFRAFSYFWLVFSVLIASVGFVNSYAAYKKLKDAYLAGEFEVVEGPVKNFVPMPYRGGTRESFTVDGKSFAYSDYEKQPGFNNTRSHGGPINEGNYVRIAFIGPKIVRL